MIKASEGGGGKGIRKASNDDEFTNFLRQVSPHLNVSCVLYGSMELSDWLVFGWDFTVWTITMKMVRFVFFVFPRKFMLSEAQKVFKKRNLILSSQQYNYSKQNLVLRLKGYFSKVIDGRRRLRTVTKWRSV